MSIPTHDLAFLPLGGTGEIGMNLNLYRCGEKWLAVDCGLGFGGNDMPEIELMVPDPSFIAERRENLVGLVITHAHEDHIGAIAWLWRQLRCPITATPFAAAVLRRKLSEAGLLREVKLNVVPPGGAFDIAPFSLRFIPVSHSVPEAQALAIRTPAGLVIHSGDWKFDPEPMVGLPTDVEALKALGDEGVLALVSDSTNATVEGASGSEASVRKALAKVIGDLRGRVAVTCFASNVARIESVAMAARDAGRKVVLVGRSLRNMTAAALETGYLKGLPPFLREDDAADLGDDEVLMLVTGSQGEPRSALARIAADAHPRIALGEGDTVLFSSRVIPGNEQAIHALYAGLGRRGVNIIAEGEHGIHVSGHPARDEIRRLYELVRPQYAVPVHGEWRHLQAHAALARECGASPVILEDGDLLQLSPGRPEVVDSAPVGRLAIDGNRLLPISGNVLSARRRMLFNGVVVASFAVDKDGKLRGTPQLSAPGLLDPSDAETDRVTNAFAQAVSELPAALRREDETLLDAARAALRRALGKVGQKRPAVEVHLLRV